MIKGDNFMKKLLLCFFLTTTFFTACKTQTPQVVFASKPDEVPQYIDNRTNIGNTNGNNIIEIPNVEYTTDEDFPEIEIVGDALDETRNNTTNYTIAPRKENYNGGAVTYNYVPNNIYKVYLSPRNICDLQLEPGETVVSSPACGDTINFQLGTGFSIDDGIKVEHLYLKALASGNQTTLTVNTDKRVYQFKLMSYQITYMPIINFNYPLEAFETMKQEAIQRQNNAIYLQGDLRNFNFSYDIIPQSIHKPDWMPSKVFNDGKKTYIHFPSASRASYAPVLFAVENKQRVLVNYRVFGKYYVVDQILDHAELVLDVNAGNVITIKRSN
jgi:type IV secretion system protein VirB9